MSVFKLNICTPSKVVVQNVEAESFLIPTTRGEINVLKDHTHLISKLDTGVLTINVPGGKRVKYVTTVGICKVLNDTVTILTQTCEAASELDKARAERAFNLAKSKLSGEETLSDFELTKFRRKLSRAQIRMNLAMEGHKN